MKSLPLRPLPVLGEALSDYLERLANANGYQASELWSILDRGEYPHEQVLSGALNGHILPEFSGPTQQGIDIEVQLSGLRAADFTRLRRRWCPLCIENAAWLRPAWRLKVMTVCEMHRVQLLETCPACRRLASVQAILHGTCECGLCYAKCVVPATRMQIQLAQLLANSLKDSAILSVGNITVTLTAQQLVRMIFYTGQLGKGPQLSRPGQVQNLEELSVALHLVDGAATLVADWPNAFWHCLELYVEASPADASVRRVFGALYQVIYRHLHEPVFQFWRDAFELFLLDHWRGELCGRHRLFKEQTIQAHPNRGLACVARMTGVGSETLKRMVHQDWLPGNRFTGPKKRELITVDCKLLARLIPDPAEYLDMRSAARVLGVKRTRLRELVATGVILADAKPDWRRSNQWNFRRSEVCGFLEQLRQAALPNLPKIPTVPLNYALRYWRVNAMELAALLCAVKQGEIPFTLRDQGLLRDITFDEAGLREWLAQHRALSIDWVAE